MMSFANEYIQKYGQKAIQAYKRSLNHADSSDSPRLQPKHPTNRSKSCKSITSKSKKKNHSSKSILNLHGNKSKPTSMNQAFSNIQLNLGINQPQRKKLIISDMNTPKNNTPNKVLLLNKSRPQSKLQGISTNVNVYVQAVNRSKSKQSTPGTGVHNSRQNSTHKKGDMECQMVRQILGLLQQQQGRRQSRNIKLAKEKLTVLMKNLEVKDRQFQRMEKKFAKMRNIVGKSNKNSMIFSDERERQMQQKVHQLQNQLNKYKQKEKTLLRIVQTLSASKQVQRKMDDSESQHHNQDMND